MLYHAKCKVLPPTSSRLCLMITANDAVMMVDKRPNMMTRELVKADVDVRPEGQDVGRDVL